MGRQVLTASMARIERGLNEGESAVQAVDSGKNGTVSVDVERVVAKAAPW